MGHQESLLVCRNRETFTQFCKALNTAMPEFEDIVSVYAIGKLKKRVGLVDFFTGKCFEFLPKGAYFVWWGGERWYQTECYRELPAIDADWPEPYLWECVFCDYIANMNTFLADIDTSKTGELQENERICIFEIPDDENIREEYIQIIDTPTTPEGGPGRKESTWADYAAIDTTTSEHILIATKVRTEAWDERTEIDISTLECAGMAAVTEMFANHNERIYAVTNIATGEKRSYGDKEFRKWLATQSLDTMVNYRITFTVAWNSAGLHGRGEITHEVSFTRVKRPDVPNEIG